MQIEEEHKELLKGLGLTEADFLLFDGETVRYQFAADKGVRIYDPYYRTSYREFIDVDGWSAWSTEQDTFLTGLLRKTLPDAEQRHQKSEKPSQEEIAAVMNKKFRKRRV